ncbi:histidine--tRNA ligase [Methyloligella sp. 2.7D]|uniref:histidine--tRNA ligase n=1 Tax=unclassified Methyloligella TaxID=2625955 RepID=UPI00157DAB6A|nr:histidine--tRNA ligase [Methyloligella sp. GL2]QKP78369.1 histidine--tRNA ligase [Methyloligella sp. GL2]
MSKNDKPARPEARLPKGLQDASASEIRQTTAMLEVIRRVYEAYGFEPLETPSIEYTDALGKFLPDQDRPNEGVFSFQDDDEQWLSLRYDLTAPLARYVAANAQTLPKPFRRYQTGPVFRNEKPGPGRFRQFTQFDADTVGTPTAAADAELCMLAADVMEALGIQRGDYVIKVSNRKLLDGVMEKAGVASLAENPAQRLTVMRAVDKLDRLGVEGVTDLLGKGRKDESGDFTEGAKLAPGEIETILAFVQSGEGTREEILAGLQKLLEGQETGAEGAAELAEMTAIWEAAGYGGDRIMVDPSIVRGLEYYTGPVFEAELTFEVTDDDGRPVRFGSVGAGGRYDGLVQRFTGQEVPATGFSMGVSRLRHALDLLGKSKDSEVLGPVVVLVLDKERRADYFALTKALRDAGIRAEMYLGGSGMKAQMKYADKRGAPCVVIQGGDELAQGMVTIKDLIEGARLAEGIEDNAEWRESRPAQFSVGEGDMVAAVKDVLARYES